MKQTKIIKLSIGDYLYKYTPLRGVFKYKVIGVRNYESNSLYEIECLECKDHYSCHLLVCQEDNANRFKYVQMVDEDDENEQYYWHNDKYFFQSEKECKNYEYKQFVKRKKEDLEKMKKDVERLENNIKEIEILIV